MIKPEAAATTATKIPATPDTHSEPSSSHTGTPKTDDSLDPESDLFSRKNPSPAAHKGQNSGGGDLLEQADTRNDHIHDIHTEFNRPRKK